MTHRRTTTLVVPVIADTTALETQLRAVASAFRDVGDAFAKLTATADALAQLRIELDVLATELDDSDTHDVEEDA